MNNKADIPELHLLVKFLKRYCIFSNYKIFKFPDFIKDVPNILILPLEQSNLFEKLEEIFNSYYIKSSVLNMKTFYIFRGMLNFS